MSINYTLNAAKQLTLNGVSVPEFTLNVQSKVTPLTGDEILIVEFTKSRQGKDLFNQDETKHNDDVLIKTSYLFKVLDLDAFEVLIMDIDENISANSLAGRLYFEEDGEPSKSCAVGKGYLQLIKKNTMNHRAE